MVSIHEKNVRKKPTWLRQKIIKHSILVPVPVHWEQHHPIQSALVCSYLPHLELVLRQSVCKMIKSFCATGRASNQAVLSRWGWETEQVVPSYMFVGVLRKSWAAETFCTWKKIICEGILRFCVKKKKKEDRSRGDKVKCCIVSTLRVQSSITEVKRVCERLKRWSVPDVWRNWIKGWNHPNRKRTWFSAKQKSILATLATCWQAKQRAAPWNKNWTGSKWMCQNVQSKQISVSPWRRRQRHLLLYLPWRRTTTTPSSRYTSRLSSQMNADLLWSFLIGFMTAMHSRNPFGIFSFGQIRWNGYWQFVMLRLSKIALG